MGRGVGGGRACEARNDVGDLVPESGIRVLHGGCESGQAGIRTQEPRSSDSQAQDHGQAERQVCVGQGGLQYLEPPRPEATEGNNGPVCCFRLRALMGQGPEFGDCVDRVRSENPEAHQGGVGSEGASEECSAHRAGVGDAESGPAPQLAQAGRLPLWGFILNPLQKSGDGVCANGPDGDGCRRSLCKVCTRAIRFVMHHQPFGQGAPLIARLVIASEERYRCGYGSYTGGEEKGFLMLSHGAILS